MAIVKFCSSMEAAAGGRGVKGIQNLMKARLTINDEDELRKNLKDIYGSGRSRTVHGTNNNLNHDWNDIRNRAEQYARMCLGPVNTSAVHRR